MACVGISMVGGTIADLFRAHDRGPAMNLFALIIFIGQALGGLTMGWVGQLLGYQWCFGVQGILAAVSCITTFALLKETRANTLLQRRAARLTKETGIQHIAYSDLGRSKSLFRELRVTALRPLRMSSPWFVISNSRIPRH